MQQHLLLIAKTMILESNQVFSQLAKKTKDDSIKQILMTEIKFNEKSTSHIKEQGDDCFTTYKVISLDPVFPRPLNPLVEEPGEHFDSQKILEDIGEY